MKISFKKMKSADTHQNMLLSKGVVTHESRICRWGGGGHVHSFWDRKLNFCMDIGLDLYFHNLKKKLRYPPSGPPQGGWNPQIHPQNWGGGHAPPNWARKLIFGMDTGLDLYYHNLKDFWDGSTLDPPGGETPRTTPETPQQKVGGGAHPHFLR